MPFPRAPSLWLNGLLAGSVIIFQLGCTSTRLMLPQGPSRPVSDYQETFQEATEACRGVRTIQLAMAINARTGEERLRGDVLAALARPASFRLVGVASFGAPGFVLVADPNSSTLVLPRDRRVVEGATAADLVEALAGLALDADELRAVLTGCVVPEPLPTTAEVFDNGWVAVTVGPESTVYVDRVDEQLVVVAGSRPGLTVWYTNHVRGLPRRVDVRARTVAGVGTELSAELSQVSINIELDPETFVPPIRDDFMLMTLDEFRGTPGPLDVRPEGPGASGSPSR